MKISLTKRQYARISEILGNLGLVSLASIVVPYWFSDQNIIFVISGLVMTFASWYTSIVFARK